MHAGGVALIKDVKNPISLARKVMEKSPLVLLAGPAASNFAMDHGIPMINPEKMVTEYAKGCMKNAMKEYGVRALLF